MTNNRELGTGQQLYNRAKQIIPGGTQLLTKRPEMFLPEQWPSYYSKAQGVEVWDLDGNKYIDMSYSGVGTCILGHADPEVNAAVHAAVDSGSMSTLNCPEELELAELLVELHPWSDMVRFARSGGEGMAIAVRIARAKTGRDKVAFCGYHGWHDWYLAANLSDNLSDNQGSKDALASHLLSGLSPEGVPSGLQGTALPFHYNQFDELEAIAKSNPGEIAAVVLEPVRLNAPEPGFLERVRQIATRIDAALIFDETSVGFRLTCGGAHLLYGVNPDIAVFAKAMGNGYPMAAVIGTCEVMSAAQGTFISSTYWTERIGPTAALATIRKLARDSVPQHLNAVGKLVQDGWKAAAAEAELQIAVSGFPPLSHFDFQYPNGQAIRTLFTQLMLDKGYLASNTFYATFAHQPEHITDYVASVGEVFGLLAQAVQSDSVEEQLQGPVAHDGFQRLT